MENPKSRSDVESSRRISPARLIAELSRIPAERLVGYLGVLVALTAYSGYVYMVDGLLVFETTLSLAERGSLALSYPIYMSFANEAGESISPFGPGQSILGIPFYLAGRLGAAWAGLSPSGMRVILVSATMLVNVVLYGIGLSLTARLAGHWGAGKKEACWIALALGVGTFWWVYSQTLYRQMPAAVLTVALFERLARFRGTGSVRETHAISLLLALLIQFRLDGILILPIVLVGILWDRLGAKERIQRIGVVALWMLIAGAGVLTHNAFSSGSPFEAISPGIGFDYPIHVSLPFYFFSWKLSIFLYSPPLLLFPWAIAALWRRNRRDATLVIMLTAMYLLLYARYNNWPGGISWGPRFTLVQTPVWIAALGAWLVDGERRRTLALAVFTIAGIPIQLLGILLDQGEFHDLRELGRWTLADLTDTWWIMSFEELPMLTTGFILSILVLAAVLAVSLRQSIRAAEIRAPHTEE